jgi:hypothetical protein
MCLPEFISSYYEGMCSLDILQRITQQMKEDMVPVTIHVQANVRKGRDQQLTVESVP